MMTSPFRLLATVAAVLLVVVVSLLAGNCEAYRAAVARHENYYGDDTATPAEIINENMRLLTLHVKEAKKQGAQLVVLPEFGIGGDFSNRETVYPYLENIPDIPEGGSFTPCTNGSFTEHPLTFNMSCLALQQEITVAFNYYDIKLCDRATDRNCPDDGRYQYIAEVIFGPDGAIIQKYYKLHVWFRRAFDNPPKTWKTFILPGTNVEMGIFVCFDIMWDTPAVDLVNDGIKHFVYSVAMDGRWGKQIHRSWSEEHDAILITSNLGQKWSGIYVSGEDIGDKIYPISGHPTESIVVADVPE